MNFLTASNIEDTALGHGVVAPAAISAEIGTDTPAPQGGALTGGNMTSMILMYVAIFGVAWLFIIRPQRKRQKTQQEMQASLKVGDNIVTNSGLFGKIVDVGSDVYIIEFGTNKGIRIPVMKNEILAIKEPSMV